MANHHFSSTDLPPDIMSIVNSTSGWDLTTEIMSEEEIETILADVEVQQQIAAQAAALLLKKQKAQMKFDLMMQKKMYEANKEAKKEIPF